MMTWKRVVWTGACVGLLWGCPDPNPPVGGDNDGGPVTDMGSDTNDDCCTPDAQEPVDMGTDEGGDAQADMVMEQLPFFVDVAAAEPNDIPSTAVPLEIGQSFGGIISPSSEDGQTYDQDVFSLQLEAGQIVELEVVEMPFARLLDALERGDVDLVVSSLTITPARNARVAFAGPYMISGSSLLDPEIM